MNSWKNIKDVIDWFNNIDKKKSHTMIYFDMFNFNQSISKEFLQNA